MQIDNWMSSSLLSYSLHVRLHSYWDSRKADLGEVIFFLSVFCFFYERESKINILSLNLNLNYEFQEISQLLLHLLYIDRMSVWIAAILWALGKNLTLSAENHYCASIAFIDIFFVIQELHGQGCVIVLCTFCWYSSHCLFVLGLNVLELLPLSRGMFCWLSKSFNATLCNLSYN